MSWTLLAVAAALLLLSAAALMQYHLIEQVSRADRRQHREYTERAVRNFGGEFREELASPLLLFRPLPAIPHDADLAAHLAGLASHWRESSRRPRLLSSVAYAEMRPEGFAYRVAPAAGGEFKEAAFPTSLSHFRHMLEEHVRTPGGEPHLFPNGFAFMVEGDDPVLVFPLVAAPRHPHGADERQHHSQAPEGFGSAHELKGWCFLTLDAEYLRAELLPELVERHFGRGEQSDYRVTVTAGEPPRVVYQIDPSAPSEDASTEDAGLVIFGPHVQPGRPAPPPVPPHHAPGGPQMLMRSPFPPEPEGSLPRMAGPPETNGPGAWRLSLRYKAGSLETLVTQARRRNLALSFGVLLLLAGSTLTLGLAARRARRLARQQLEFVAGVSHELRTPLTVIQSTSYNLARGTVQDPARVRKYGAVIQGEARRLIAEVERMLGFAGIQSGRAAYDFRLTDVGELIGRALEEFRPAFEEGAWTVEEDVAESLPPVMADARAVESAVKNLVENGLKYGAAGRWLKVSARAARNGKGNEVRVTVEDRGPGVEPSEAAHIFEPFYRGGAARDASAAGGAGLGLALVRRHAEAHGGRVTVARPDAGGASFTLHLPAKEGGDA
ncbi:MAG TPA: HAMP domain-containing sensor histidine kinase [Pyrinomonadaceae bacterium]|jgi:signal transduction histidine kinase|nr:HAMP domain-containing sensor histidine kinase [Pyrinomonadaceae bacterium]